MPTLRTSARLSGTHSARSAKCIAETPREIVGKLHAAIARTLNTPKVQDKIEAQGAQVLLKDPEAFAAFLHADANLMRGLIRRANMTAN
jgi:tripartite-type tricarboxylate transporter receptor subunit TctC